MLAFEGVIVASHRRSGTHLTIDSLRANVSGISPVHLTLERLLPKHKEHLTVDQFDAMRSGKGLVIIKTHTLPTFHEFAGYPDLLDYASHLLNSCRLIYVQRDGRDVMVSFYEYQRAILSRMDGVSFSAFLRNEIKEGVSLPRYWASHVVAWTSLPNTLGVTYETFHDDYLLQVSQMSDHLGLSVCSNPVDMILSRNRDAADKSSAVMFRKGQVGEWQTYFSDEDLAFFDAEVAASTSSGIKSD